MTPVATMYFWYQSNNKRGIECILSCFVKYQESYKTIYEVNSINI